MLVERSGHMGMYKNVRRNQGRNEGIKVEAMYVEEGNIHGLNRVYRLIRYLVYRHSPSYSPSGTTPNQRHVLLPRASLYINVCVDTLYDLFTIPYTPRLQTISPSLNLYNFSPFDITSVFTMRAVVYDKTGDSSVLQVRDIPKPTAGPDDVLVKIEYAGINFLGK